jgi:uncharacterized damage-inducible protein DinB
MIDGLAVSATSRERTELSRGSSRKEISLDSPGGSPMKTMSRSCTALVALTLASAIIATAQTPAAPPANPLSAGQKMIYGYASGMVVRSAEMMPEENYAFKPTPDVRSFGQILGHVADAQYMFCSTVLGEKNPGLAIEKTKTSKADLVQALKDAVAYCNKAYDGLTDATAVEPVKIMGGDQAKLTALSFNNVHTVEHYGNLITYLRLKGLVPPSSEPRK